MIVADSLAQTLSKRFPFPVRQQVGPLEIDKASCELPRSLVQQCAYDNAALFPRHLMESAESVFVCAGPKRLLV